MHEVLSEGAIVGNREKERKECLINDWLSCSFRTCVSVFHKHTELLLRCVTIWNLFCSWQLLRSCTRYYHLNCQDLQRLIHDCINSYQSFFRVSDFSILSRSSTFLHDFFSDLQFFTDSCSCSRFSFHLRKSSSSSIDSHQSLFRCIDIYGKYFIYIANYDLLMNAHHIHILSHFIKSLRTQNRQLAHHHRRFWHISSQPVRKEWAIEQGMVTQDVLLPDPVSCLTRHWILSLGRMLEIEQEHQSLVSSNHDFESLLSFSLPTSLQPASLPQSLSLTFSLGMVRPSRSRSSSPSFSTGISQASPASLYAASSTASFFRRNSFVSCSLLHRRIHDRSQFRHLSRADALDRDRDVARSSRRLSCSFRLSFDHLSSFHHLREFEAEAELSERDDDSGSTCEVRTLQDDSRSRSRSVDHQLRDSDRHQYFRYVQAVKSQEESAYFTIRFVSNRIRNSRFSQAVCMSLIKMNISSLFSQTFVVFVRVFEHEVIVKQQMLRNIIFN